MTAMIPHHWQSVILYFVVLEKIVIEYNKNNQQKLHKQSFM